MEEQIMQPDHHVGHGFVPNNDLLAARVRAALATAVTNPGAIDVMVQHGVVTLGGPVLAHELGPMRDAVRRVLGVTSVDCRVEPQQASAGMIGVSSLSYSGTESYRRRYWPFFAGAALVGAAGFSVWRYVLARRAS